ncbi:MAG: response regulator transcription factor [Pseudomonadota bacterium]
MQHSDAIKVHVMHADQVVSAGVVAILTPLPRLAVSSAHGGPEARAGADVLVCDYRAGIAAARQSAHNGAGRRGRIVILSQYDKESQLRCALASGVDGYLLQACAPGELIEAVRALGAGQRYLSEAVARTLAAGQGRDQLTARETDVLHLLAKGCCNKLIARELGIGSGTVKTHVQAVMSKLGAHARTHAVALATQRGLIGALPAQGAMPERERAA